MDTQTLLIILAALVAAIALIILLRPRRKDHDAAISPADSPRAELDDGLADSGAAAVADVAEQFLQVETHAEVPPGPADDLTQIKGLGPKAAARLGELGVTRYAQIAAWGEGDVARIDDQLGPFKGRIARDRWIEQARLLAAGDRAGFEATFGKLGS